MPCLYKGRCGGCFYTDINYEEQLSLKEKLVKDNLFDIIRGEYEFEKIIESPLVFDYRNKMELTFGDNIKNGPLTLGMHEKRSFYNILDANECELITEDMRKVVEITRKYFDNLKIPYFHKKTHKGYLRHLIVRKSYTRDELLINIVTTTDRLSLNAGEETILKNYVDELLSSLKEKIAGIIRTKNDRISDAVVNEGIDILYGKDFLFEKILGLDFKISPFSFFQTNTFGAEKLYEKVKQYVILDNDKYKINNPIIYDLYCGTGTIGQIISNLAKKVYGVEIIEEAVLSANENAKLNNLTNVEFIAEDVNKIINNMNFERPDIIVLDPPREGVIEKSLEKVIEFGPKKIVYVSCKIESLRRDMQILQKRNYLPKKICPVDMFPWTKNVETVVLFVREN